MIWQVDPTSEVPLYEQVAACGRRAIAEGQLRKGERLPAGKDLAASLDINLHTVLRAYQVLRDEGLVDLRRGRGAVVTGARVHGRLSELLGQVTDEAVRMGMDRTELVRMLEERWT